MKVTVESNNETSGGMCRPITPTVLRTGESSWAKGACESWVEFLDDVITPGEWGGHSKVGNMNNGTEVEMCLEPAPYWG